MQNAYFNPCFISVNNARLAQCSFIHRNRRRHRSFSMFPLSERFSIRSLSRSASTALCRFNTHYSGFRLVPLFCFQRFSFMFWFLPRCLFHLEAKANYNKKRKNNLRVSPTQTSQIKNSKPTTVIYSHCE